MVAKIKIDDLAKEVMNGLEEYNKLVETDMKAAVKKAANTVKSEIKETAPRRTGKYASSWVASKENETSSSLNLVVHSKTRYQLAHLLEFGHAKRGGGRVAARPHIANAEVKGEEVLEEEITRALR